MQNFQEQEWNLLAEMVHCKIEKGNQNKVTKLTILTFQYSSDNFTIHNICNRSRWLTLNYWYIFLSAVAYDWQCCNIISRVNWSLNSRDYYYRLGQTKFITLPQGWFSPGAKGTCSSIWGIFGCFVDIWIFVTFWSVIFFYVVLKNTMGINYAPIINRIIFQKK